MKTKRIATIFLFAIFVLALGAAGGFYFYKTNSVVSEIRPIAVRDNIMIKEYLLLTGVSAETTWLELFEKAQKNIEEREEHVRQVEAVDAYVYKNAASNYIQLLQLENDYAKEDNALLKKVFAYSLAQRRLKEADEVYVEADKKYIYESTDNFDAHLKYDSMEDAHKRADDATKEVAQDLNAVKSEAERVVESLKRWLNVEDSYYPSFLPKRDLKSIIANKINLTENIKVSDLLNGNVSDATH